MKALLMTTALLAFAAGALAESPFAGAWKQNRDKTQFDSRGGVMKIEADGAGIRYSSGGIPIYGGSLDGKERPGLGNMANDTFTLEKAGDRGYRATMSRNGKTIGREVIEVSADGRTLTTSFTTLTPRKDGKNPTNEATYGRTGGDGKPYALIGTWKIDRKLTKWAEEPIPMIIAEAGGVLTMSNPVTDSKTIIDLSKSEVTVTGAVNPPAGIMRTVKAVDARSFELSTTRNSVTSTSLYGASEDGKTLTIRNTTPGGDGKPVTGTSFYERQ